MFAIICLSIAFIANSISIFFQEKEIFKLRMRCNKLDAEVNFLHVESPEGLTIEHLRGACRLQHFLDTNFDGSKGVSKAVPDNE